MMIRKITVLLIAVVFLAALGSAAFACMNHTNADKDSVTQEQSSDTGSSGTCSGCPNMNSARMQNQMKQGDPGRAGQDMQSGDHGMMRGNMSAPENSQPESTGTR